MRKVGAASSERRGGVERRSGGDRRRGQTQLRASRFAGVPEQLFQHVVRYGFILLAVGYFRLPGSRPPVWLDLDVLGLAFVGYALVCTLSLLHTMRRPVSPFRFRLMMWCDLITVALVVVNDPAALPPSLLAFLMVVLGNGMRYGLPLFGEGIAASVGLGAAALVVNHLMGGLEPSLPLLYMGVVGIIIAVYAYVLMARIELSHSLLERNSRLDALTGLVNRRALFELAQGLFGDMRRNDGRIVVMFADMDRFKAINDQHGHGVGDTVLTRFGGMIGESVRAYDVAARYGGDEFVILLVDATLDQAELVARRIQKRIESWARDFGVDCTITFGLAEAPVHGTDLPEVLRRVDEALYRSKKARRRGGVERAVVDGGSIPVTAGTD